MEKKLSILMPVYQNEKIEVQIRAIHVKIVKPFKKIGPVEIIVAEDGSTDNTRKILKSIKKKYNLTLNLCNKRRGYIKAAKEIYAQAKGEYIFFTDSDGEHDPEDFWKLWTKFNKEKLDLVVGYKKDRKPYYRTIISKFSNVLLGIFFGVWLKDANSGFRILKNKVAKRIIPLTGTLTRAYNAETFVYAKQMGYKYGELPTKHTYQPSLALPLSGMPKTILKGIFDLFKLKFKLLTSK